MVGLLPARILDGKWPASSMEIGLWWIGNWIPGQMMMINIKVQSKRGRWKLACGGLAFGFWAKKSDEDPKWKSGISWGRDNMIQCKDNTCECPSKWIHALYTWCFEDCTPSLMVRLDDIFLKKKLNRFQCSSICFLLMVTSTLSSR